MSKAKPSLQEAIQRKKDQLMDSEMKEKRDVLVRSGDDVEGDGRPDFERLHGHDEMDEEAAKYFNRSVVKERPVTEDEKENDVSKHTDGAPSSLRQQITRRKTQLIQSHGSSVIINDPQLQEGFLSGATPDKDRFANHLNQRLTQLRQQLAEDSFQSPLKQMKLPAQYSQPTQGLDDGAAAATTATRPGHRKNQRSANLLESFLNEQSHIHEGTEESVIIRTDAVMQQVQEQHSTDQTMMDLIQDDTTVRMDSFISVSAAGMDSKLGSFVQAANQQQKFQQSIKDISPLGAQGDNSGFLSGQSFKQGQSHPSHRKKRSQDSSALRLVLKTLYPEGQGSDACTSAFVPTGDGTRIHEGPGAASSLITPRFQSHADSQKCPPGHEGDPNLRDAGSKLSIGMQELSFIRKEGSHHPGNISDFFIDSFLQDKDIQLACNLEDDNQFTRSALDENLTKSLDPNGLFKDVEAQEFDLDDSVQFEEDMNLEVLKKISEATKRAASHLTRTASDAVPYQEKDPQATDSEPGSGLLLDSPEDFAKNRNKFDEIDKISEDDAEYEEDESQASDGLRRRKSKRMSVKGRQNSKDSGNFRADHALEVNDKSHDISLAYRNLVNKGIEEMNQQKDNSEDMMDFDKSADDEKMKAEQTAMGPLLEQRYAGGDQQARRDTAAKGRGLLGDDFSQEDDDPDADKRSQDSVDRLWQAVLNNKNDQYMTEVESHRGDESVDMHERESTRQKDTFMQQYDQMKEEQAAINLKKQEEEKCRTMIEDLISFQFPTTADYNQHNIDLKHYERYFKDQLHLAPSTDRRSIRIMNQMTLVSGNTAENDKMYHDSELGCAGFYGINNDPEVFLGMLLTTSCFEVMDQPGLSASGRWRSCSLFNNPQQYLVPHQEYSQLKRALKKIVQSLISTIDVNAPTEQQRQDGQNQTQENKGSNPFGTDVVARHLMEKADHGVLLMLGKMYFHVCKFKHSIYSLKMAVHKCKLKASLNQDDLEQSLLWMIVVQKVFLANKIRVLKKQITQSYSNINDAGSRQSIFNPLLEDHSVSVRAGSLVKKPQSERALGGQLPDSQKQAAHEIFELYQQMREDIDEFESFMTVYTEHGSGMKNKANLTQRKSLAVVLYIKLKLQIFKSSSLFVQIAGIHAAGLQSKMNLLKQKREQQAQAQNGAAPGRTKSSNSSPVFQVISDAAEPSSAELPQQDTASQNSKASGGMFSKLKRQFTKKGNTRDTTAKQAQTGRSSRPSADQRSPLQNGAGDGSVSASVFDREARPQKRATTELLQDFQMQNVSREKVEQQLEKIIRKIQSVDPYIAQVAKSELSIWRASSDNYEHSHRGSEFDAVFLDHPNAPQPTIRRAQGPDDDGNADGLRQSRYHHHLEISKPSRHVKEAIQLLKDLIADQPKQILASIKLWQLYRLLSQQSGESLVQKPADSAGKSENGFSTSQKSSNQFDYFGFIHGQYDSEENKEFAMRIAETMHRNYYNMPDEEEDLQASQRLRDSGHDIEKQMLITLVNVKSLYDIGFYRDCFEMLQSEYLRNSSYTSLLYLYGKYIIKSNTIKDSNIGAQKKFLGSGIGAMEECLKACIPEFHCRIKYYVGLAYNNAHPEQKMPLKTMNYWSDAKEAGFMTPIQGMQKQRLITRFLEIYSFMKIIINMINSSLKRGSQQAEALTTEEEQQATQYLSILSNFEEKIDGPSSLLLKAHIYAHTVRNEGQAVVCFRELVQKYPKIISNYLEFWEYARSIYVPKKQKARRLFQQAKQKRSRTLQQEAINLQKESKSLLTELKSITQQALIQSNSCTHVSTSEWVKVRIIAAKTYLFEKKFNKAIHILTDLCYIIPPDMLRIGEDRSNLQLYDYADESEDGDRSRINCGGIRFCRQVLAVDEEYGSELDETSDPGSKFFRENRGSLVPRGVLVARSPGWKQKSNDKFKNKIFIDKHQEQQILEDFQETTASAARRESAADPRASETSGQSGLVNNNFAAKKQIKAGEVFEMDNNFNSVLDDGSQVGEQDNLLFENSQSVSNFGFDDNRSQWNMSNFDQAERETTTLRMSNVSTNHQDTGQQTKKRRTTAAFPLGGAVAEAGNDTTSEDNSQDKLFVTSMMADPEPRSRRPAEKSGMNRSKSELRMGPEARESSLRRANEDHVVRFEEQKEDQDYFDQILDQKEATVPEVQLRSDSANAKGPAASSSRKVAAASGRAPPRRASIVSDISLRGMLKTKQSLVQRRSYIKTSAQGPDVHESAGLGEEAEELRLDFADLKKIDQSITSPRPPRMFRLTQTQHLDTHGRSSGLAAADGFNLIQHVERERSESIQSHKFGLMHLDELNNEDLLLRMGPDGADYQGRDSAGHEGDYDTVGINDTIFAVNSDFYFLYMIGKMCNESGHNLFQGLLALNDYYLFCWHYGQSNLQKGDDNKHGPLTSQSARTTSGHRIQDCVKTLLCMAEICEKLHQPRLALQLFHKILEDRETLIKYLGCKKWVLSAEAGLGRVWKTISWHQPEQRRVHGQRGRAKEIVGGIQERIKLLDDYFAPSAFRPRARQSRRTVISSAR